MVTAFYFRHSVARTETFDGLEDARSYLANGEDTNFMSAVGALEGTEFYLWNSAYSETEVYALFSRLGLDRPTRIIHGDLRV